MRGKFAAIVLGVLAALTCAAPSRAVDNDAARQRFLEGMRKGYAERAPGAPDLISLLAERFPSDFDPFVKAAQNGMPQEMGRAMFAKVLVTIQQRDGDDLYAAPDADLIAVLQTQKQLIEALHGDVDLCQWLIHGAEAKKAPTPDIALLSVTRVYQSLAAIADGRDDPVAARKASDADFPGLVQFARAQGIDTSTWTAINAKGDAPDPRICTAAASIYGTVITANGPFGERLRATFAHDLLVQSMDVYRQALKDLPQQ